MTTTIQIACYRRPDPETGQIHRRKPKAGDSAAVGEIEYTNDPAIFFHSEKYRGFDEPIRIKILGAQSLEAANSTLAQHPLTAEQTQRWVQVRERVLRCAVWFTATQVSSRLSDIKKESFDGLDVAAAIHVVQERLKAPTRLVIAGSRDLTARAPAYALIDWFVENRDLGASGHGVSGDVDEVISGNANGSDSIGEEWAMRAYIPVAHFPASWELGKGAGYARNEEMEKAGTHLLAFHLMNSKGTAHMIDRFVLAKKPHWKFTERDINKMREILADRAAAQATLEDPSFTPDI